MDQLRFLRIRFLRQLRDQCSACLACLRGLRRLSSSSTLGLISFERPQRENKRPDNSLDKHKLYDQYKKVTRQVDYNSSLLHFGYWSQRDIHSWNLKSFSWKQIYALFCSEWHATSLILPLNKKGKKKKSSL